MSTENERLRVIALQCAQAPRIWCERAEAAESRLAEATELLRDLEARVTTGDGPEAQRARAFLTNQPAASHNQAKQHAAPARTEAPHLTRQDTFRAMRAEEAKRRVLDALSEIPDGTIKWLRDNVPSSSLRVFAKVVIATRNPECNPQ